MVGFVVVAVVGDADAAAAAAAAVAGVVCVVCDVVVVGVGAVFVVCAVCVCGVCCVCCSGGLRCSFSCSARALSRLVYVVVGDVWNCWLLFLSVLWMRSA